MSKSIRLSEKHGLNPCIPICFWCGQEKNEVALLGKLKNDEEAPRSAVINYEPCEKCQEMMNQGVTIMVGRQNQDGIEPTGKWCVMKDDAVKRVFGQEQDSVKAAIEKRKMFVDDELFDQLMQMYQNANAEDE